MAADANCAKVFSRNLPSSAAADSIQVTPVTKNQPQIEARPFTDAGERLQPEGPPHAADALTQAQAEIMHLRAEATEHLQLLSEKEEYLEQDAATLAEAQMRIKGMHADMQAAVEARAGCEARLSEALGKLQGCQVQVDALSQQLAHVSLGGSSGQGSGVASMEADSKAKLTHACTHVAMVPMAPPEVAKLRRHLAERDGELAVQKTDYEESQRSLSAANAQISGLQQELAHAQQAMHRYR